MYYAKQLCPEHTDNSFYLRDFMDWNPQLMTEAYNDGILNKVRRTIENFYEWEYHYGYRTLREYLEDYLPAKENGKKLSPMEIHQIRVAYERNDLSRSNWEDNLVLTMLSICIGVKYHIFGIRGCCQGDYARVYAPANTSERTINYLESLYFNLGCEVIIDDEHDVCSSPEEISGYSMYITDYDVKRGIATELGCPESDIKLWEFDHFNYVPVYKEV